MRMQGFIQGGGKLGSPPKDYTIYREINSEAISQKYIMAPRGKP